MIHHSLGVSGCQVGGRCLAGVQAGLQRRAAFPGACWWLGRGSGCSGSPVLAVPGQGLLRRHNRLVRREGAAGRILGVGLTRCEVPDEHAAVQLLVPAGL